MHQTLAAALPVLLRHARGLHIDVMSERFRLLRGGNTNGKFLQALHRNAVPIRDVDL